LPRDANLDRGAGLEVRLLSPDRAAAYLGLRSRWAIYRLVASGQLRAVKVAGKIRVDHADLDTFIEALKGQTRERPIQMARQAASGVPQSLSPLTRRAPRVRPVTIPVTAARREA